MSLGKIIKSKKKPDGLEGFEEFLLMDKDGISYVVTVDEVGTRFFNETPAATITETDILTWNAAIQPGDNVSVLTNDANYVASGANISVFNNDVPYLTVETDPIFLASDAAAVTSAGIANWNTAFGWGDHALAGYLTSETDPIFLAAPAAGIASGDITNWDTAFGWGNPSGVYEPIFSKNTGFNKNFGTSAGTVSEGNHNHGLITTIIDIGDWNMNSSGSGNASITVNYSFPDITKVRRVTAFIRNDAGTIFGPLDSVSGTSTPDGGVGVVTSSALVVHAAAGRNYDTASYTATSYNRGYIVIESIP